MSIFTFVGGGLLQQDDNYSLQVITTTVQTIIPALLQVCFEQNPCLFTTFSLLLEKKELSLIHR